MVPLPESPKDSSPVGVEAVGGSEDEDQFASENMGDMNLNTCAHRLAGLRPVWRSGNKPGTLHA